MILSRTAGSVAVATVAALALTSSAAPRPSAPGPLHIHTLRGSLVRIGPNYYELVIRANVCFPSAAIADNSYPDAIGVSHYEIQNRPRRRWVRARSVVDIPHYLVPFGETWEGACGTVVAHDPIPPTHYGVESLGNPLSCYGVGLTLKVGRRSAGKRAIIQCPFKPPGR